MFAEKMKVHSPPSLSLSLSLSLSKQKKNVTVELN